jgi:uncharacterized protein (DUF58 family)
MAYDPADLKLPGWVLALLDRLVAFRLRIYPGWRVGVTRPGGLLLASLLGLAAAAVYSGNNLLYLCGAMLLSMEVAALATGVWLVRAIPKLGGMLPKNGHVADLTSLRIPVDFHFPFPSCLEIAWRSAGSDTVLSLRVEEGKSLLTGRLPPLRRGVYNYDRCTVSTEAPLGWWHIEHNTQDQWGRMILPRATPWDGLDGPLAHPGPLEGDEWSDLRAYVHGDSPARIHWRKSVLGDWTVKRFAAPRSHGDSPLLRVDLRAVDDAAFERLLSRVYGWMLEYPDGNLILGQTFFDLGRPDQHQAALRKLATVQPEQSPPAGEGGVLISSTAWNHAA